MNEVSDQVRIEAMKLQAEHDIIKMLVLAVTVTVVFLAGCATYSCTRPSPPLSAAEIQSKIVATRAQEQLLAEQNRDNNVRMNRCMELHGNWQHAFNKCSFEHD